MKMKEVNVLCLVFSIAAGSVFATIPTPLAHWSFDVSGTPGADQTPDEQGLHPADLIPGDGQPALGAGVFGNAVFYDTAV